MPWDQKKMLASLKFKLNWKVIPMQTRSTTAWKVGNSNRSSLMLGTLAIRNLPIKKSPPINTQKLYWLGGQPELSCGPCGELWLVWRSELDFPWRERTLKSGGFCLKLRTEKNPQTVAWSNEPKKWISNQRLALHMWVCLVCMDSGIETHNFCPEILHSWVLALAKIEFGSDSVEGHEFRGFQ